MNKYQINIENISQYKIYFINLKNNNIQIQIT